MRKGPVCRSVLAGRAHDIVLDQLAVNASQMSQQLLGAAMALPQDTWARAGAETAAWWQPDGVPQVSLSQGKPANLIELQIWSHYNACPLGGDKQLSKRSSR